MMGVNHIAQYWQREDQNAIASVHLLLETPSFSGASFSAATFLQLLFLQLFFL